MVLIPMWQYCCFGAGYAEWGEDIDKLIANYEFFLFCQYAGTYTSAERRWQVVNNPLDTFILKYLFSTSLRPFHVFIHTL